MTFILDIQYKIEYYSRKYFDSDVLVYKIRSGKYIFNFL